MLLIITFTSMIVVFGGLAVLFGYIERDEWDNSPWFYSCIILAIFGVVASVIFGIISLAANSNVSVKDEMIKYEETVNELQSTREYVLNIEDDHARSIAITQYNEKVREFKTEIRKNQNQLSSPWINWFTCKAYNDMDADVVDYL